MYKYILIIFLLLFITCCNKENKDLKKEPFISDTIQYIDTIKKVIVIDEVIIKDPIKKSSKKSLNNDTEYVRKRVPDEAYLNIVQ